MYAKGAPNVAISSPTRCSLCTFTRAHAGLPFSCSVHVHALQKCFILIYICTCASCVRELASRPWFVNPATSLIQQKVKKLMLSDKQGLTVIVSSHDWSGGIHEIIVSSHDWSGGIYEIIVSSHDWSGGILPHSSRRTAYPIVLTLCAVLFCSLLVLCVCVCLCVCACVCVLVVCLLVVCVCLCV